MKPTWLVAVSLALPISVTAAPSAPADDGAYNAIIDRPLFDPSRKKYEPPAVPDAAPTDDTPVVAAPSDPTAPQLLGVVASDSQAIVVVRGGDGTVLRLAQGEAIDGWRVVAIRPRGIDVERDGVRQSLDMPPPGSPAPVSDPNLISP